MMAGIHPEVLLAAAYAVLLMVIAASLEWLGRHAHRRSLQYHTAGFTYQRERDAWKCPTGEQLFRIQTDHTRRVVVYRAPAHKCNACCLKVRCTDSNQGRKLEYPLDAWFVGELGRFHRGISLTLILLVVLLLAAELLRYNRPADLAVLAGILVPTGAVGVRLFTAFLAQ
jgi:hypothetical protein